MIDLVLQEFARLIEQIEGDQTIREPPDHLVAATANRSQVAKVVEHRQRIDRRKIVAFRAEEELGEQRRRVILNLA